MLITWHLDIQWQWDINGTVNNEEYKDISFPVSFNEKCISINIIELSWSTTFASMYVISSIIFLKYIDNTKYRMKAVVLDHSYQNDLWNCNIASMGANMIGY